MNFVSGLIVYIVIYTIVLFMVLPFGVKVPETIKEGHASSAPSNPKLLQKAGVAAIISGILWWLAYWFITSDYGVFY